MSDATFLNEQITVTKAQIVAYQDAITALAGGVQIFKLDTGQTIESVTEHDVEALQKIVDGLYNRLSTLCATLNGGNVLGRPAW